MVCRNETTGSHGGRDNRTPVLIVPSASAAGRHSNAGDQRATGSDRLAMIVRGVSLTGIGEQLCLSVKTVSTYRTRLLDKLRLASNADLVRYCLEHGIGD